MNVYSSALPIELATDTHAVLPTSLDGLKIKISLAEASSGMPSKASTVVVDEQWSTREAVAASISAIGSNKSLSTSPHALETLVQSSLDFVVSTGVVDPNATVRASMLEAGRSMIDAYGLAICSSILAYLNEVLARQPGKTDNMSEFDQRNEAAVILLGAAGKHLDKSDPNVIRITESMLTALKTPSDSVQRAVADSLIGLVQLLKGSDEVKEQLV